MPTDWEFCAESLRAVSRTFSRPIEMLPDGLRETVTCGYLLCRMVDTVEDDASFSLAERDARYAAFDRTLSGQGDANEFAALWLDGHASPEAERLCCKQIARVLNVLDAQPRSMGDAVRRWVTEMARGMQIYSHRAPDDDGIIAPANCEDLERYCYFVAGTVGRMLTELFVLESEDRKTGGLDELGEAFGTGLQLVNILKDVTDDFAHDRCFVPRSLCRAEGLRVAQLVDPSRRAAAHRAVRPLFTLARTKLDRALDYALAVPSRDRGIRMFCLLPLWLAVTSLGHAYGNDAMFEPSQSVKISRRTVQELTARCMDAVSDDTRLRSDYEALWSPVARLMVAASPLDEWPYGRDAA